jgi:hypothetical protein
MTIKFDCPKCQTAYAVNDQSAGRPADCKVCGLRFSVPTAQPKKEDHSDPAGSAKPPPTVLASARVPAKAEPEIAPRPAQTSAKASSTAKLSIRKSVAGALLGAAVFVGMAIGCLGGGVVGYQIRKGSESGSRSFGIAGGEPGKNDRGSLKLMSKKEFETAVGGKTRDQIAATVGRPDETREKVRGESFNTGPAGNITWVYDWWLFHDRVLNDATGRPYAVVAIRFNYDGKADRVEYP